MRFEIFKLLRLAKLFLVVVCQSVRVSIRLSARDTCFFSNILKTQRWLFINFCRHIDTKKMYLHKRK